MTSYSKYAPDESYKNSMSKAIQDYKDYKKLFVVDEGEGNFKGTITMPYHVDNFFRPVFRVRLGIKSEICEDLL